MANELGATTLSGALIGTTANFTGNITAGADLTLTGDLSGGTDKNWSRFIGAKEMHVDATGPALSLLELQSGNVKVPVLSFDQSTIEYVGFALGLPDGYDGSALNFRYYWTATAATAGNVLWNAEVAVFANDEGMAVSPTVASVTDGYLANKDCHIIDKSITPNGATAGDTLLSVYLYRFASDAADTLDADAHLIGVRVGYA